MNQFTYNLDRRTLANPIYDFKEAESEQQKRAIISAFCSVLSEIDPKIEYRRKTVSFHLDLSLPEMLLDVFKEYTSISYNYFNSKAKNRDPYCVLKQQLNKIYIKTCDKNVCLSDGYIANLSAPKRYYFLYRQLAAAGLSDFDILKLKELLAEKIRDAEKARVLDEAWKLDWSYDDFMSFVEDRLYKIFTNYSPPPEIGADGAELIICDFVDEDRYIVSYIWRSLYGYISLYRKKLYGLRERRTYKLCPTCGKGIVEDTDGVMFCYRCRPRGEKQTSHYELSFSTEARQFEPDTPTARPKYSVCEMCGCNFLIASKGRIPKYCKDCKLELSRKRKRDWVSKKRQNSSNSV